MVEIRFPRYIDSPPQFLIWELDEVLPVAFCMLIFLPSKNLLAGLVIGVIIMKIYRKLKDKLPQNFLFHYLWFWGVWQPKSRTTLMPKGYISRYQE